MVDNDDNKEVEEESRPVRRSSSSKGYDIFGYKVPADTANAVGIGAGIVGLILSGFLTYNWYNSNKQQEEAKKAADQALIDQYLAEQAALKQRNAQQLQSTPPTEQPPASDVDMSTLNDRDSINLNTYGQYNPYQTFPSTSYGQTYGDRDSRDKIVPPNESNPEAFVDMDRYSAPGEPAQVVQSPPPPPPPKKNQGVGPTPEELMAGMYGTGYNEYGSY